MTIPVILSPHFDDAVFNCWHVVNRPTATVLTIFAGAPVVNQATVWDRLCGERNGRQMMENRRAENQAALSSTGARIINLDLLDAQYRETPISVTQLADAIMANTPRSAVYIAPLAGSYVHQHSDHVLIRQAALELARRGRAVAFYPDAPYMGLPKKPTKLRLQRMSERAGRVLGGKDVIAHTYALSSALQDRKRDAMHAYASQWRMTNLVSLGGLSRLVERDYELLFGLDGFFRVSA